MGKGALSWIPSPCGSLSSRCAKAERRSGSSHPGDRAARPAFGSARPPVDVRCFRCFVVRRRAGGQNPGVLARKLGVFWALVRSFLAKAADFFCVPSLGGMRSPARRRFSPRRRTMGACLRVVVPASSLTFPRWATALSRRHRTACAGCSAKRVGGRQMRFSPSIDYKKRRLIT